MDEIFAMLYQLTEDLFYYALALGVRLGSLTDLW